MVVYAGAIRMGRGLVTDGAFYRPARGRGQAGRLFHLSVTI